MILIGTVTATCLVLSAHLSVYWLSAVAVSPLLLLFLGKKPTLKSCQNVFSIVFALALGCVALFSGTNAVASLAFFTDVSRTKFVCYFFLILLALSSIVSWIISVSTKKHYAVFSLGVVFSIAYVCVPQTTKVACAACFALLAIASSCVLGALLILYKRIDEATKILKQKNVSAFLLLRNLAFVLCAVNLFVALTNSLGSAHGIFVADTSANVVCGVLMFVLLFSYLRQPLDDVTEHKMNVLNSKKVDADLVKTQIADRLCNVQNFPLAKMSKVVCSVLPYKVVGMEKVTDTTACFVANHYEIYGPLACYLHFPLACCIWTEEAMTDQDKIAKQLTSGVNKVTKKWLIAPIRKSLPQLIARPALRSIECARPIAVCRKDKDKIGKMFEETVQALNSGDNVIVFPEKTQLNSHYKTGGVDQLQTGFVEMAEKYYEATGKEMSFYPLYIDKKGKQMIVGQKVAFDSTAPLHVEKLRIAAELYRQLCETAKKCQINKK